MSNHDLFDPERLQSRWVEATSAAKHVTVAPSVALPIDPLLEVPRQIRALRKCCAEEFPGQEPILAAFLTELESATTELLWAHLGEGAVAEELAEQTERLHQALTSLEDVLEVLLLEAPVVT